FELVLKHLLVFATQRDDAGTLRPVQTSQLAVPDEYLLRALHVELDVVVDEQPHPLDRIGCLRNPPLVVKKLDHHVLHDLEEKISFRRNVVVQAPNLNADLRGDVAQGRGLKTASIEEVDCNRSDFVRGALAAARPGTRRPRAQGRRDLAFWPCVRLRVAVSPPRLTRCDDMESRLSSVKRGGAPHE